VYNELILVPKWDTTGYWKVSVDVYSVAYENIPFTVYYEGTEIARGETYERFASVTFYLPNLGPFRGVLRIISGIDPWRDSRVLYHVKIYRERRLCANILPVNFKGEEDVTKIYAETRGDIWIKDPYEDYYFLEWFSGRYEGERVYPIWWKLRFKVYLGERVWRYVRVRYEMWTVDPAPHYYTSEKYFGLHFEDEEGNWVGESYWSGKFATAKKEIREFSSSMDYTGKLYLEIVCMTRGPGYGWKYIAPGIQVAYAFATGIRGRLLTVDNAGDEVMIAYTKEGRFLSYRDGCVNWAGEVTSPHRFEHFEIKDFLGRGNQGQISEAFYDIISTTENTYYVLQVVLGETTNFAYPYGKWTRLCKASVGLFKIENVLPLNPTPVICRGGKLYFIALDITDWHYYVIEWDKPNFKKFLKLNHRDEGKPSPPFALTSSNAYYFLGNKFVESSKGQFNVILDFSDMIFKVGAFDLAAFCDTLFLRMEIWAHWDGYFTATGQLTFQIDLKTKEIRTINENFYAVRVTDWSLFRWDDDYIYYWSPDARPTFEERIFYKEPPINENRRISLNEKSARQIILDGDKILIFENLELLFSLATPFSPTEINLFEDDTFLVSRRFVEEIDPWNNYARLDLAYYDSEGNKIWEKLNIYLYFMGPEKDTPPLKALKFGEYLLLLDNVLRWAYAIGRPYKRLKPLGILFLVRVDNGEEVFRDSVDFASEPEVRYGELIDVYTWRKLSVNEVIVSPWLSTAPFVLQIKEEKVEKTRVFEETGLPNETDNYPLNVIYTTGDKLYIAQRFRPIAKLIEFSLETGSLLNFFDFDWRDIRAACVLGDNAMIIYFGEYIFRWRDGYINFYSLKYKRSIRHWNHSDLVRWGEFQGFTTYYTPALKKRMGLIFATRETLSRGGNLWFFGLILPYFLGEEDLNASLYGSVFSLLSSKLLIEPHLVTTIGYGTRIVKHKIPKNYPILQNLGGVLRDFSIRKPLYPDRERKLTLWKRKFESCEPIVFDEVQIEPEMFIVSDIGGEEKSFEMEIKGKVKTEEEER